MKYLNNQRKIILSMAKCSITGRELKNIKNIRAKVSKKHESSSSGSSISDSCSYLPSDSDF